MTYVNNEDYTMIIHSNKIQYKKNQQMKYNFRQIITTEDLDNGIMLNFPYNNVYYSYKSPSTSIPLNRYFRRSGVIPYTIVDDVRYFCLAVDNKYGNLTDFGGGVKKFETFTGAASRELEEESLGVFKIGPEAIYSCSTAIYDNHTIVMFVPVFGVDISQIPGESKDSGKFSTSLIDKTISEYFERLSSVVESETKGIFWIPEDKFYDLIKSGKNIRFDDGFYYPSVYRIVADLLRSVSNINEII